jgi:hypothetical protein
MNVREVLRVATAVYLAFVANIQWGPFPWWAALLLGVVCLFVNDALVWMFKRVWRALLT